MSHFIHFSIGAARQFISSYSNSIIFFLFILNITFIFHLNDKLLTNKKRNTITETEMNMNRKIEYKGPPQTDFPHL